MLVSSRLLPPALTTALLSSVLTSNAAAQMPPPPEPPENPITPEKVMLGKFLFWEEQLSSDDTVACGTCHQPGHGGADVRSRRVAGLDGRFGNDDDVFGSPGMVRTGADGRYHPDPVYGLKPIVSDRVAGSFLVAQYASELMWDGLAGSSFYDPETGLLSIANGGALESQAVLPILSAREMAHEGRTWSEVHSKLERVQPMALATDVPEPMRLARANRVGYPGLFEQAFGDPKITAERIAYAIASYERSLVPDQSPWDRFNQGDWKALTPQMRRGLQLFTGRARCDQCHPAPLFTDGLFHNTGIRPATEDRGREHVSGDFRDRGKFRTPSLRNTGLRLRWTHNGSFIGLKRKRDQFDVPGRIEGEFFELLRVYNDGGRYDQNVDPLIQPLGLLEEEVIDLYYYVVHGLIDPRVANEEAPFDRPTLHSELHRDSIEPHGRRTPGSGGFQPAIIADTPAHVGHPEFKIGIRAGLGGAAAILALAPDLGRPGQEYKGVPIYVALDPWPLLLNFSLEGIGVGEGHATFNGGLPDDPALRGQTMVFQWFVFDPGAAAGLSASEAAVATIW